MNIQLSKHEIQKRKEYLNLSIKLFEHVLLYSDIKDFSTLMFFESYSDLLNYNLNNSFKDLKFIYQNMHDKEKKVYDNIIDNVFDKCKCDKKNITSSIELVNELEKLFNEIFDEYKCYKKNINSKSKLVNKL